MLAFTVRRLLSSGVRSSLNESLGKLNVKSTDDDFSDVGKLVALTYNTTNEESKKEVLASVAEHCGIRHDALRNAIVLYGKNPLMAHEVYGAACPLHHTLLRSIGNLQDGIRTVCDMRTHLLNLIRSEDDKLLVSSLRRLEESSRDLLTTWFCLSNLKLNRLTWESPGDILHKIASYEAVHPVRGIVDFRKRLGSHRRCFYFSHEAMPREPLVMVHVALMDEIADSVQNIVNGSIVDGGETDHTTAIYYSITSTQKGLAGIDLGNLLIKQVAATLQFDVPSISVHSTLSPIPGFRSWLLRSIRGVSDDDNLVDSKFVSLVEVAVDRKLTSDTAKGALLQALSSNGHSLSGLAPFRDVLMHSCAKYLYAVKRNGFALNPVANFHLRNGAVIYRLNWGGDSSGRGLSNSFGIMVNYRYHLDKVHENLANYTKLRKINADETFLKLL